MQIHKTEEGRCVRHTARAWLNRPGHHSIGLVYFEASFFSYNDGPKTLDELTLTIGDCNRQIALELSHSNEEETENSIEKLDKIIAAAELAKTYLQGEVEP